jgi:acetylornithine deacetylase
MDLPYNLILAATAEEENSGPNGLNSLIPELDPIAAAIVGEPTGMDLAVAEKGLIVLRCRAEGKAGHAAHNNHDNAIIRACRDINWFSTYRFRKISDILGPVKMTVTMINAGEQHNVVPDRCDFTIDIRTNELYTHEDILETIKEAIQSGIVSSSLRLRPSHISDAHPLVRAARKIGLQTYGSATLSDQAVLNCPSVKIGPGETERSHTADEYVYLDEIREGIRIYRQLLETFFTL